MIIEANNIFHVKLIFKLSKIQITVNLLGENCVIYEKINK